MVDPAKMDNGYQHCAVDHVCKGCLYHAEFDEDCIGNLIEDMREFIEELKMAKVERDALAEEVQKMIAERQWKRMVDEAPPYCNTWYKVWTKDKGEFIAIFTPNDGWATEFFTDLTQEVTHWMPLDEGPKEE